METLVNFFSDEEKSEIAAAIGQAELRTSGEIRVHLENKCNEDVLDHAAFLFSKLQMHTTVERNGVMFYVAVQDHKFAVIGDVGIDSKVEDDFWDSIKDKMQGHFRNGEFKIGLIEGIHLAGEKLSVQFPNQKDDVNEISTEISFGE